MIENVKFVYSPLKKAFKKQVKVIEEQWRKQTEAFQSNTIQLMEDLYPRRQLGQEAN